MNDTVCLHCGAINLVDKHSLHHAFPQIFTIQKACTICLNKKAIQKQSKYMRRFSSMIHFYPKYNLTLYDRLEIIKYKLIFKLKI